MEFSATLAAREGSVPAYSPGDAGEIKQDLKELSDPEFFIDTIFINYTFG